jgi:hypothetical protein
MKHENRRRIGGQVKGIENIFIIIIAENFPNLGKK